MSVSAKIPDYDAILYDTNCAPVPVWFEGETSPELQRQVCEDSPLSDWWATIDADLLEVKEILVQSVDVFGNGRIGFVKCKVDAREVATDNPMHTVLFLRGGSVAVLPLIVTEQGELFTLVCRQMSVAAGYPTIGCPSGMLDGDGNFAGKAAAEVREETGIYLEGEALIDVVDLFTATDDPGSALWSSPGASEETFRLYTCVVHGVTNDQIDHLVSTTHGAGAYEHITLLRVPLTPGTIGQTMLRVTKDVKSYAAGELVDKAIAREMISLEYQTS